MAVFNVQTPNGIIKIEGPDDATDEELIQAAQAHVGDKQRPLGLLEQVKVNQSAKTQNEWDDSSPMESMNDPTILQSIGETANNLGAGAIRGAGSIGTTILWPIDAAMDAYHGDRDPNVKGLISGEQPLSRHQERVRDMQDGLVSLTGADPESIAFKTGKVAGEIAGTAGTGGLIGKGLLAVAPKAIPIADAISSGGFNAGGMTGFSGLGVRTLGGAINGAASTAIVDPNSAIEGAEFGAALPGLLGVAAKTGKTLGTIARPFTRSGQDNIAADVLRSHVDNPDDLLALLDNAAPAVNGSPVTTTMAAGDVKLSGLQRTLANASPDFNAELTQLGAQRNTAQHNMLDELAGNDGKYFAAKTERDSLTGPMRESVLDSAGRADGASVINSIDALLKNPNNAGELQQGALSKFRNQIAKFTGEDGAIDGRALYSIRKDINDVLGGKLSGDAGNMKHASSQLIQVKELIDNAIDQASKKSPGKDLVAVGVKSKEVNPLSYGDRVSPNEGDQAASWKDYLSTYTEKSKPINQMEVLQDVYKRIQNGTPDISGNMTISPARLNNLLKNEGGDLAKILTKEQMESLRKLASDLNAGYLSANAGKAVGSNTVQNLASQDILKGILGQFSSHPLTQAARRPLDFAYRSANDSIMTRVGDALLDPETAKKLLKGKKKTGSLLDSTIPLAYRISPALATSLLDPSQ